MLEERLCRRAEKATREWAEKLVKTMLESDDDYLKILARTSGTTCQKYKYCKECKDCLGLMREKE
jgi:hypothetical protein